MTAKSPRIKELVIARIAIAAIAIGLMLLTVGIILSEGYSTRRGFLESLPKMKVKLVADRQLALFFEAPLAGSGPGRIVELEGAKFKMPTEMDDKEVGRALESFVEQRYATNTPKKEFLFVDWVLGGGIAVPLRPLLATASTLFILGVAALFALRMRIHEPNYSGNLSALKLEAEATNPTQIAISIPESTKGTSRWRVALHLWGGICMKAAADVSGLFSGGRGGRDAETAAAIAAGAGLAAALLIVAGYYLSVTLVAALDRLSISPGQRKIALILLPIIYFASAILVGGMVNLTFESSRK